MESHSDRSPTNSPKNLLLFFGKEMDLFGGLKGSVVPSLVRPRKHNPNRSLLELNAHGLKVNTNKNAGKNQVDRKSVPYWSNQIILLCMEYWNRICCYFAEKQDLFTGLMMSDWLDFFTGLLSTSSSNQPMNGSDYVCFRDRDEAPTQSTTGP